MGIRKTFSHPLAHGTSTAAPGAEITIPIFQKRKLRLQGDFSELSGLLKLPLWVEAELELELRSFTLCPFLYVALESLFSKTEEPSDDS